MKNDHEELALLKVRIQQNGLEDALKDGVVTVGESSTASGYDPKTTCYRLNEIKVRK